jgi:hypothetical protein
VALGGNDEPRSLSLEKLNRIGDEVRIEAIALENRDVRASTLEYSLLDCLTVAGSGNRKNFNQVWIDLPQPVAGPKRTVRRSILHEDDLSQDNTRRKTLYKGADKALQVERLVVRRYHDTVFH